MRALGGGFVVAAPARERDDQARIGRVAREHEARQEPSDLGHAQGEDRDAGRSPFFRGRCRARIAAMNATMRIAPWQVGHASGSTSKICWSSAAQRRVDRKSVV